MNSVHELVKLGERWTLYGVPIHMWQYDWFLRPDAIALIPEAIHIAIVWPEQ